MRNIRVYRVLIIGLLGAIMSSPAPSAHAANPLVVATSKQDQVLVWLESSLKRVYPLSTAGSTNLSLLGARNGKISFQICTRNQQDHPIDVRCTLSGPDDIQPLIRVAGLVPLPHLTPNTAESELDGNGVLPGMTPDPLFPENHVQIGPFESRSFWITVTIPSTATPGLHQMHASLAWEKDGQHADLIIPLDVSQFTIQPRRDFHVTHWWRGEATWDYYKTGMFDDRWYELTKGQLVDMLNHGSDVIYVPVFFDRREIFKHPCQLLKITEPAHGKYEFDWSEVKKFTDLCKAVGFKNFEWSHLWIYWGVQNPIRAYKQNGTNYVLLWPPDISGFSETYLNFLRQFLPAFHDFLAKEHLLDFSYFHLSDEPGGDAVDRYRKARQILHEIAPWMKVMDALSDIRYGREGITDMPVPMVSAADNYIKEGIPHWVYYCCWPEGAYLNRFMDTPLPKVRMSGWLFYRLGAKGFLHWGYNYWDKMASEQAGDPFHDGSNGDWPGIPYGDPFEVYPGTNAPIDSIRWEVFAESLQDYAILQTAGIKPEDPLLSSIKSYSDFPKSEQWIDRALKTILTSGPETTSTK
jgi:hypothetical protein